MKMKITGIWIQSDDPVVLRVGINNDKAVYVSNDKTYNYMTDGIKKDEKQFYIDFVAKELPKINKNKYPINPEPYVKEVTGRPRVAKEGKKLGRPRKSEEEVRQPSTKGRPPGRNKLK